MIQIMLQHPLSEVEQPQLVAVKSLIGDLPKILFYSILYEAAVEGFLISKNFDITYMFAPASLILGLTEREQVAIINYIKALLYTIIQ